LRSILEQADSHYERGHYGAASQSFEALLQRAQEKTDRPMEVVARAMLAKCLLRRRDVEGATDHLRLAAMHIDPVHLESYGRYRGSLIRVAMEEHPAVGRKETIDYLRWAEEHHLDAHVVDACMILSGGAPLDERLQWLTRGIDFALDHGTQLNLGRAYNDLGAAFDQLGQEEEALESYQQALAWHRRLGSDRDVASACWAVGALACRVEDWPMARELLEDARAVCERTEGCMDIHSFSTADLAQAYEAAGDVIEARRLVLDALKSAREQNLAEIWPQRWQALIKHADRLDVL
jgi:tetratricopeptide (TPR) repeat protein